MSREESTPRIRALVVDDEPLARSNLAVLLRLDPEIEIVGECGSGQEGIEEIRSVRDSTVEPVANALGAVLERAAVEAGGMAVSQAQRSDGIVRYVVERQSDLKAVADRVEHRRGSARAIGGNIRGIGLSACRPGPGRCDHHRRSPPGWCGDDRRPHHLRIRAHHLIEESHGVGAGRKRRAQACR